MRLKGMSSDIAVGATLIGAKLSDSRASLYLSPLAGRGRNLRSSRKFRVRGPLRESELSWRGTFTLSESALVERPPHPDPLPASGEREQNRRTGLLPPVSQGRIKLNPNIIDAGMKLMAIRTGLIGKRSRRRERFGAV